MQHPSPFKWIKTGSLGGPRYDPGRAAYWGEGQRIWVNVWLTKCVVTRADAEVGLVLQRV